MNRRSFLSAATVLSGSSSATKALAASSHLHARGHGCLLAARRLIGRLQPAAGEAGALEAADYRVRDHLVIFD